MVRDVEFGVFCLDFGVYLQELWLNESLPRYCINRSHF